MSQADELGWTDGSWDREVDEEVESANLDGIEDQVRVEAIIGDHTDESDAVLDLFEGIWIPKTVDELAAACRALAHEVTVLRGVDPQATSWTTSGVIDGEDRRKVHAMAELLDEVRACSRGELPPPDHDQLKDWLRLLNIVAGSDAQND